MAVRRNGNKTMTEGTKKMGLVKIDKKVWKFYIGLDSKTPNFIVGSIYRKQEDVRYSRTISWRVDKYDMCTLGKLTIKTTDEDGAESTKRIAADEEAQLKACEVMTEKIFETVGENKNHAIYKLLEEHFNMGSEVAATKDDSEAEPTPPEAPKDKTKVLPTKDALDFMTSNGVKGMSALNAAVARVLELEKELAKAKASSLTDSDSIYNALRGMDIVDAQEIIYDFIPQEFLSSEDRNISLLMQVEELQKELIKSHDDYMEMDYNSSNKIAELVNENHDLKTKANELTADNNNPDPDDKMPVPAPTFNVEDLKAELKAEILSELREEIKASLSITKSEAAPTLEESKPTTEEKLPVPEANDDIVDDGLDKDSTSESKDTKKQKTKTPDFKSMRNNFKATTNEEEDDIIDELGAIPDDIDDNDLDSELKEAGETKEEVINNMSSTIKSAAQKRAERKAKRAAANSNV